MELNILIPDSPPPVERVYTVSMVIRSFKGRRNVEVHLFRPDYDPNEVDKYNWDKLIGDPVHPDVQVNLESPKYIVLESFTLEERDAIVEYLKDRYGERLETISSGPLALPVPLGMPALSEIPGGKTLGFIHFELVPNYTLPFAVHGLYDLAQHDPLVRGEENGPA